MYKSTELFIKELEKDGIPYQIENSTEDKEFDWVQITSAVDNLPAVIIQLFFGKDEGVSIRCFGLCKVDKEKIAEILVVINMLNNEMRYAKFFINDENEVCLALDTDLLAEDKGYGERVMESVRLCLGVVDDAYPILVKEIWKDK